MHARWSIAIDRPRRLVRVKLEGMFNLDDVRAMDQERHRAITRLGCPPNQHLFFCDATGTHLSTPEVAAALHHAISNPLFRAKRCTIVVSSMLARLQARRVVDRADVQLFDDLAKAEAWLLSTVSPTVNNDTSK